MSGLTRKLKVTSLALGTSALLALSAGAASAAVITIDGVSFGAGANLQTATIWENTVDTAGEVLNGIGRVTAIDSAECGGLCWTHLTNGTELTFEFSYVLERIVDLGGGVASAWFSDGSATFYADDTPNFATTVATATDGDVWLNLIGAETGIVCGALDGCFSGAGTEITLSSFFNFSGDLGNVLSGFGSGFLDVGAGTGSANTFFNTNTWPSGQDVQLGSSFSVDTTGSTFPLSGSADLRMVAIPEPGSLSLLGGALIGLGWFIRRRRVKR